MTNTTTPKELMGLRASLIENLASETAIYGPHVANLVDNLLETELLDLDALRARFAPAPAVVEEAKPRALRVGDKVRVREGAVGDEDNPAAHRACIGSTGELREWSNGRGGEFYSDGYHIGPLSDFELV